MYIDITHLCTISVSGGLFATLWLLAISILNIQTSCIMFVYLSQNNGWSLTPTPYLEISSNKTTWLTSWWPHLVTQIMVNFGSGNVLLPDSTSPPSLYLKQCWLIISEVLWHSPENNFTKLFKLLFCSMSFHIIQICCCISPGSTSLHISPWCHIYASVNGVNIGSDNGLLPIQRQAIIKTNAGLLSIGPLVTNFIEILIRLRNISLTKRHMKISSVKWWPFCPRGEELMWGWYLFCSWHWVQCANHRLSCDVCYPGGFIAMNILPSATWHNLDLTYHDGLMTWKCVQNYWPFVRGIYQWSPLTKWQ